MGMRRLPVFSEGVARWPWAVMLACVFLWAVPGPAAAEGKPRVAVLEVTGALPRGQRLVLSDKIRAGVLAGTRGKGLQVMTRESMAMLLKDMGLDCTKIQGECEVETARNIGASYVITGSVQDQRNTGT